MYILYTKKDIINRLNKYFNNLEDIKLLCNVLGNDVDLFYQILNKIISFSYNNSNKFMRDTADIIDCYYFVNNEYSSRYSVDDKFKSKVNLPNRDTIESICRENIIKREEGVKEEKERQDYYLGLVGFNEVGMTYTRPELVTIDDGFKYYYATATNNVYEDYKALYDDDRDNPIHRNYEDNVESIKYDNNIRISKFNNLNIIENGRHRLLYLLHHGRGEEIPCIVTRRIENKDFNVFTNYLRKKYHAYIYKNNIFNDDLDIIIVLNNKMYNITSIRQLAEFIKYIDDESIISKYYVSDFLMNNELTDTRRLKHYVRELHHIYNEEGYDFLNQNFTDLLDRFRDDNNEDFYKAFDIVKYYYLKNKIYNKQEMLYDEKFNVNRGKKHI